MGNHHHHHHHHNTERNIGAAFCINLLFAILEIVGGIYTNSLAILSDALHDLGDSLSLGMAWYFEKVSHRKSNDHFTYGFRRFSVLGALVNAVILVVGSVIIIREAVPRILSPEESNASGIMALAVLGIFFNGLAYYKLSGGHSHNEKVVSLHLLEDVLGWVAVLIGGIVMYFTNWFIVDPILSILIALFIAVNVFRSLKSTILIILQGTPEGIDLAEINRAISGIDGVLSVHDIHVWTMDGQRNILTAHVVTPQDFSGDEHYKLKQSIHRRMDDMHVSHCTLEIEREGEECHFLNGC